MATIPRKKLGTMPCEGQRCKSHEMGVKVYVYRSQSGALGYTCHECGRSPYVKPGTEAYDEWLADMVPIPDKQAAPPESGGAAPVAASVEASTETASKPAKQGFRLGAL